MNYIPHTEADRQDMLAAIGVERIEDLFDAVPEPVRFPRMALPPALSEMEILRELSNLSGANASLSHFASFLGAGAYQHYIPSLIDHMILRGEFLTAYTPYQPEVSQGTLQAIFEFQSMIRDLTGMEICTASHYDGATSFAEAALMAMAVTRRSGVLVSRTIHPQYREVLRTYTQFNTALRLGGDDVLRDAAGLAALIDDQTACVCVAYPDFLGQLEDLSALARAAHAKGALLVVVTNPIALGVLTPPAEFDADIVVGEGQPLGVPLSFGGPYLGFFCTKRDYMRRIPGRIVGETVDKEGQRGFVLTLKTREQDIRREKATSNICTNQGLMALCACVYLAVLGRNGLRKVGNLAYQKAHYAAERIAALPGYEVITKAPFYHEFAVRCPRPVAEINAQLLDEHDILGGYDLGADYPELAQHVLLCCTEVHTRDDIDQLVQALAEAGAPG